MQLIQVTTDNLTQINRSVTAITEDSTQLGEGMTVIDRAISEVKKSNEHLVENMDRVSGIVEMMTDNISNADKTSKTMLSKYAETSTNIDKIEVVVEDLLTKLGIGGFMSSKDLNPGMKITLEEKGKQGSIYTGILKEKSNQELLIELDNKLQLQPDKALVFELQVVAGSIIYCWEEISVSTVNATKKMYKAEVNTFPQIKNRRKYPRVDISNICSVKIKESGEVYTGKLNNISANGFAFMSSEKVFSECMGKLISMEIKDFELKEHNIFEARVIRTTDSNGVYIVGCQMLEDDKVIMEFVAKRISMAFSV